MPPLAVACEYTKYAVGVVEANTSALYWRLLDSASGSILDEVSILR